MKLITLWLWVVFADVESDGISNYMLKSENLDLYSLNLPRENQPRLTPGQKIMLTADVECDQIKDPLLKTASQICNVLKVHELKSMKPQ